MARVYIPASGCMLMVYRMFKKKGEGVFIYRKTTSE